MLFETPYLFLTVNILSVPDCVNGYFGAGCKMQCHCAGDAVCDKGHGRCPNGGQCASGFTGENCQGKNKTINVSVNNVYMLYPNAN